MYIYKYTFILEHTSTKILETRRVFTPAPSLLVQIKKFIYCTDQTKGGYQGCNQKAFCADIYIDIYMKTYIIIYTTGDVQRLQETGVKQLEDMRVQLALQSQEELAQKEKILKEKEIELQQNDLHTKTIEAAKRDLQV